MELEVEAHYRLALSEYRYRYVVGLAKRGGPMMRQAARKARIALAGIAAVAAAAFLITTFSQSPAKPTVTVQLPANEAAGYTWVCAVQPKGSFVTLEESYASDDASDPACGGIQTFVLQSQLEGDSSVSFACLDAGGNIDSTATYEFETVDATIVSRDTKAQISEKLLAPFQDEAQES